MSEVAVKYQFKGVSYRIEEYRDANGVVTFSCNTSSNEYPVFVRTNGKTVFHYKIGDRDEEWECNVAKYKLVMNFIRDAGDRDMEESNITRRSWSSSASALLSNT